jgi:hypothetical protein
MFAVFTSSVRGYSLRRKVRIFTQHIATFQFQQLRSVSVCLAQPAHRDPVSYNWKHLIGLSCTLMYELHPIYTDVSDAGDTYHVWHFVTA